MSRLLDDDQELESQQRELTLSTGAILAIFLGLVLLCAVFFGFGYNLGRKSTASANASAVSGATDNEAATGGNDSAASQSSTFDNFKPSPSSPSSPAPSTASPTSPATAAVETAPAPTSHTNPAPAPTRTPQPVSTSARPSSAAPATTPGGAFVVQIAAISPAHKDDADLLVSALHSKGYEVAERAVPQDKLIHIQVGPYATKADAEAMRERLIVDGYNAIVK